MIKDIAILAIDPATKCGFAWAYWDFVTPIIKTHWVADLKALPATQKRAAEPEVMRMRKMWAEMEQRFKLGGQDTAYKLVIVESGFVGGKHPQGQNLGHEFRGVIKCWCAFNKVNYIEVTPSELKKFATGKGNADKEKMKAAATPLIGRLPKDDNEADAAHLLNYALINLVPTLRR